MDEVSRVRARARGRSRLEHEILECVLALRRARTMADPHVKARRVRRTAGEHEMLECRLAIRRVDAVWNGRTGAPGARGARVRAGSGGAGQAGQNGHAHPQERRIDAVEDRRVSRSQTAAAPDHPQRHRAVLEPPAARPQQHQEQQYEDVASPLPSPSPPPPPPPPIRRQAQRNNRNLRQSFEACVLEAEKERLQSILRHRDLRFNLERTRRALDRLLLREERLLQ